MNLSQISVVVSVVAFAAIIVMILFGNRGKKPDCLSILASLAFLFTLAGLFLGKNPFVGFGLIEIGVVLIVIDIINKSKKKSDIE